MTENNHTTFAMFTPANAANIEAPLGQLDAAIGAAVSTLATTAKTLVGAANELKADLDDLTNKSTFNALGLSKKVTAAWDDFDDADQSMDGRVTPSGHIWVIDSGGTGTASVVGKKYVTTGNSYAELDYGAPITSFGGNFSFLPGASTELQSGQVLTLATLGAIENLGNLIHLAFGAGSWSLLKRVSGGAFVNLIGGDLNLRRDGTVYSIRMDIVGTTVTVHDPEGKIHTYTDADFATMPHTCAFWQIGGPTPELAPVGRWESAWIGEAALQKINPAAFASLQETGTLRGMGLTRMQHIEATLASGTGWYRIANCVALGTYVMMGKVKLTAIDSVNQWMTVWEFDAKGLSTAVPELKTCYFYRYGAAIDQVRLSNDDSGSPPHFIGLDVHVDAACTTHPVTLTVDFYGYFTPVILPVVGVTALATSSTIIGVEPEKQGMRYHQRVDATLTGGNGWYRIATKKAFTTNILQGEVYATAVDTSGNMTMWHFVVNGKQNIAPTLTSLFRSDGAGGPIQQVRLSNLNTGSIQLGLDLNMLAAVNVDLQLDFYGFFTVITNPVVGAVAEATANVVI